MKHIKIALVGLPNVGKSTFINTLLGVNLKTANFSGSTVATREVSGIITLSGEKTMITLVDLPGIYSIKTPNNEAERTSAKFISEPQNYDHLLHLINSEFPFLSEKLEGELRTALPEGKTLLTALNVTATPFKDNFGKATAIFMATNKQNCLKIIDILAQNATQKPNTVQEAKKPVNLIKGLGHKLDMIKITKIIDRIALNGIVGIPVFLGIMFLIFYVSFILGPVIGEYIGEFFDFLISRIELLPINPFIIAVIKSVLGGVSVVLGFIPQIVLASCGISLLEQTGYISRVCYLLDGLFAKFHLGGRSFIPLIIGAGCSISAYISTRIIENPREKFLTMIIIGFIPCTAKLAVFLVFCGVFFPQYPALALFTIYLFGIIFGLFLAKTLGSLSKNPRAISVIELYSYKIPTTISVLRMGWERTLGYLKNAAIFIAAFSAILSLFSLIGITKEGIALLEESQMQQSIIGQIASFISPIFTPMGFDWRMVTSLVTGLIAKEVSLSTLAVLYGANVENLSEVLGAYISLKQAIAYMVFMFFYLPCVSATASFHREVGSWKKTASLIALTTILAYTASSATAITLGFFGL